MALLTVSVALDQVSSRTNSVAWVLFLISFALVPLTFLAGVLRSRFDRAGAARILLSLDAGVPLRDAVADALHDPSLEIVYRLGDREGWVDADGRDVDEPTATPERAVTTIERGGRRVAALVHDPSLAEEPDTIDLVASAVGLPLENVRLQADLRSQFSFLRTLINTAPSLFIHLDTEGTIVNQNAAAVEAAGEDSEDAIRGRKFWDVFIDESERADVVARFEAAAPIHPAVEYENTFVNRKGENRVVFWRSAPLLDEHGGTKGIIAGGIDITARHEEAAAREREREFLNTIANEAPSLLLLIDENGVIEPRGSNKAFERELEVKPDETPGTVLWDDYVAPEEAAMVRQLVQRVAAGETVGDHDNTWVTKSGRRLSVLWSCILLPAVDDRRLLLVSGRDVTERKQREIQLQRERDITSTLMQAIPSIVVVVDREANIVDGGVDMDARRRQRRVPRGTRLARQRDRAHERPRPDRPRRRLLRADGDRLCGERRAERRARDTVAQGRRRPHRDRVDGDADRRRDGPRDVARAPLGRRRHRAQAPGRGDPGIALAHHRSRRRGPPRPRAQPARRRPAAARRALGVAQARGVADGDESRRGGRDHQRRARGARRGARGASRARAGDPPGRAHRPRARGGRRDARRPHAGRRRGRDAVGAAARRRSRRPRTT